MTEVQWHLRITLESSARAKAVEMAKAERRTPGNYVASLIEQAQKEPKDGDQR